MTSERTSSSTSEARNNDFANALPNWIDFKRGGLIAGLIGILMMPWDLIKDPSATSMAGWSGSLSAVTGDYWLLRKTVLGLTGLYGIEGRYRDNGGIVQGDRREAAGAGRTRWHVLGCERCATGPGLSDSASPAGGTGRGRKAAFSAFPAARVPPSR